MKHIIPGCLLLITLTITSHAIGADDMPPNKHTFDWDEWHKIGFVSGMLVGVAITGIPFTVMTAKNPSCLQDPLCNTNASLVIAGSGIVTGLIGTIAIPLAARTIYFIRDCCKPQSQHIQDINDDSCDTW